MSEDKFEENPNPFAKVVKNLEKDRESIIADEKLRKENEKKAQEEEYAKRIIQAEEILRGDCLEAIEAIPPLELGNRGATTFSSEAFLWFSEPGPLVRDDIRKHNGTQFLTFNDTKLDEVFRTVNSELIAVKMNLTTSDGINFEIHWKRRD